MKTITPDRETLLQIYKMAALIKQVDDRLIELTKAGHIASPYYSPRGQEIIPSAISVHLRASDNVVTIYRGMHDQIAKGIPLKAFFAEFLGRATGTCKGKGGPMHITHMASGLPVTTGIVGSGLPIANGLAWAAQLKGTDDVTICNFGDGASNIGAFHEALNLAAVWKLPVVFVCQNNGYAEHTRYDYGTASSNIAKRAQAYDIPGVQVDGNDPEAMYRAAGDAIDRARRGEGPSLVEAKTFRFRGHLLGDDSHYIPKDEMAAAEAADPLPRFRASLIAQGHADEATLAAIEQDHTRMINEAVEFAMVSAWPSLAELNLDVYGVEATA